METDAIISVAPCRECLDINNYLKQVNYKCLTYFAMRFGYEAAISTASDFFIFLMLCTNFSWFFQVNNLFSFIFQTALHLSTITRQPAAIRRLLEAGATPDIPDRNGRTALHLACEQGDLDCVKEIVRPLNDKRWNDEMKERIYNMLHERDYNGTSKHYGWNSFLFSTRKNVFDSLRPRRSFDWWSQIHGGFPSALELKRKKCAVKAQVVPFVVQQ